jgi:hypothetical protein
VHAKLGLPLMEAESRLELATTHAELGERDAAAEERAAARRIATAHGAAGLVAQADGRGQQGDRP